jgi:hypothetical protein
MKDTIAFGAVFGVILVVGLVADTTGLHAALESPAGFMAFIFSHFVWYFDRINAFWVAWWHAMSVDLVRVMGNVPDPIGKTICAVVMTGALSFRCFIDSWVIPMMTPNTVLAFGIWVPIGAIFGAGTRIFASSLALIAASAFFCAGPLWYPLIAFVVLRFALRVGRRLFGRAPMASQIAP